jgi:hypothetical protein
MPAKAAMQRAFGFQVILLLLAMLAEAALFTVATRTVTAERKFTSPYIRG